MALRALLPLPLEQLPKVYLEYSSHPSLFHNTIRVHEGPFHKFQSYIRR